jgi:hypothetical protein
MDTEYVCEFCNKSYKTLSNLNNHKKTAKFCLNLQKESNPEKVIIQLLNCEFCDKEFTNKFILNKHVDICPSKVIYRKFEEQIKEKNNTILLLNQSIEIRDKIIKEKDEKLKKKDELLNEKDQVLNENEEYLKERDELKNKCLLLTQSLEFKNIIIKDKDIIIKEKDAVIKEKEQFIQDNFKELISKQQAPVYQTTNVNNQQHITNYNNYYNKMFNELEPLTNKYIIDKINETITPGSLIYVHNLDNANSNIIDYNFACSLVNILKNRLFFTDTSRGKLVYKDENNEKKVETAETLVLESMQIAKKECLNICRVAIDIVRERGEEFTDKDYGQCISGLTQLSDCIKLGKPHAIITEIANKLCKHAKFMPSIKEFKMEQSIAT